MEKKLAPESIGSAFDVLIVTLKNPLLILVPALFVAAIFGSQSFAELVYALPFPKLETLAPIQHTWLDRVSPYLMNVVAHLPYLILIPVYLASAAALGLGVFRAKRAGIIGVFGRGLLLFPQVLGAIAYSLLRELPILGMLSITGYGIHLYKTSASLNGQFDPEVITVVLAISAVIIVIAGLRIVIATLVNSASDYSFGHSFVTAKFVLHKQLPAFLSLALAASVLIFLTLPAGTVIQSLKHGLNSSTTELFYLWFVIAIPWYSMAIATLISMRALREMTSLHLNRIRASKPIVQTARHIDRRSPKVVVLVDRRVA